VSNAVLPMLIKPQSSSSSFFHIGAVDVSLFAVWRWICQ